MVGRDVVVGIVGPSEVDGAVAGDVQCRTADGGVAAQRGGRAGGGQADGRALERERAVRVQRTAVSDLHQAGVASAAQTRQRHVLHVARAADRQARTQLQFERIQRPAGHRI